MNKPFSDIPKSLRIIVIVQLCFIFTFLVWEGIYAFSREGFAQKARGQIFSFLLSDSQSDLFQQLPKHEQQWLKEEQAHLQSYSPTIGRNFQSVARNYFFEISPWFQAWAFFSFITCLCLLYRIKGSAYAAYLLPLFIVGYMAYPPSIKHYASDAAFYPTDRELVERYLPQANNQKISKESLDRAFSLYLIDKWAHETPNQTPEAFQQQVKKGYFFMQAANLQRESPETLASFTSPLFQRAPFPLLVIYLMWNSFFALMVSLKWRALRE